MRFENYQRVDPHKGYGFGLYGEKVLKKKTTLYTGFSRIDTLIINGDRYPRQPPLRRLESQVYTRTDIRRNLDPGIGPLPTAATPRTRFEAIVSVNFVEVLKRLGLQ